MLMMRLQRIGRKNDPSFRIVVTNKRTGPKSNKNNAILGSYNPKLNHVQIDKAAATEWLSKGVQPSDTVHNILVAQGVIEGKKRNVLPKKSPIVSDTPEEETASEAPATEEGAGEEAGAPAEEAAPAADEAPAEESAEPVAEEAAEETPAEAEEETPAEEVKEETPEETKVEEPTEEVEASEEDSEKKE